MRRFFLVVIATTVFLMTYCLNVVAMENAREELRQTEGVGTSASSVGAPGARGHEGARSADAGATHTARVATAPAPADGGDDLFDRIFVQARAEATAGTCYYSAVVTRWTNPIARMARAGFYGLATLSAVKYYRAGARTVGRFCKASACGVAWCLASSVLCSTCATIVNHTFVRRRVATALARQEAARTALSPIQLYLAHTRSHKVVTLRRAWEICDNDDELARVVGVANAGQLNRAAVIATRDAAAREEAERGLLGVRGA